MVTTFTYDGLNRVTQMSYNTVSGVTTAPAVSYVYDSDPTYGTTGDGMLLRVNVGTDYQERATLLTRASEWRARFARSAAGRIRPATRTIRQAS